MADRDDIDKATSEQPTGSAPAAASAALPAVESPSISPAKADEPVAEEPIAQEAVAHEPIAVGDSPIAPAAAVTPLRLALRRRRMALLAASVTLAAALGAVIGAVAANSLSGSHDEVAGLQDRKVMQQSIARLGHELSTLKASLDAAGKSAHAQTAQLAKLSQALNEKLAANTKAANEALARAGAEVTGSISAPQTAAVQPATPLPQPRPPLQARRRRQPAAAVDPGRLAGARRGPRRRAGRRPRRHLRGRTGRQSAGPRPGRIDPPRRRPLDRRDAEGPHRLRGARPALFRLSRGRPDQPRNSA